MLGPGSLDLRVLMSCRTGVIAVFHHPRTGGAFGAGAARCRPVVNLRFGWRKSAFLKSSLFAGLGSLVVCTGWQTVECKLCGSCALFLEACLH